jgi:putative acetyltransferase
MCSTMVKNRGKWPFYGEPDNYNRFGFVQDAGLVLEGVPPEYFMSQIFSGKAPVGRVVYQPAFYEA